MPALKLADRTLYKNPALGWTGVAWGRAFIKKLMNFHSYSRNEWAIIRSMSILHRVGMFLPSFLPFLPSFLPFLLLSLSSVILLQSPFPSCPSFLPSFLSTILSSFPPSLPLFIHSLSFLLFYFNISFLSFCFIPFSCPT